MRRAVLVALALAACAACVGSACTNSDLASQPLVQSSSAGAGGAASASVVGHGVGVATTGGGSTASCSFGAPVAWDLPPGYTVPTPAVPFPALQAGPDCSASASQPDYDLADLDGDGLYDLVFTQQCAHPEVGESAWWVFANSGEGFATTPTVWALPTGFTGGSGLPFASLSGTLDCTGGANHPAFTLLDVNGDGRSDLLVTGACASTNVGVSEWWWFENDGSGFATSPATLALPGGFGATPVPFPSAGGALACSGASGTPGPPAYLYTDMTADGVPDLVITAACGSATVGTSSWTVYEGSSAGAGLATTPTAWALPGGFTGGGAPIFGAFSGTIGCDSGRDAPSFTVLDMNGDLIPDLLVTQACDNSAIGVSEWLLYPGSATGFAATPKALSLPAGYSAASASPVFANISGERSCGGTVDTPSFLLADVNGDGILDLLVTELCNNTAVGATEWLFYPGSTTGFGAAEAVALPTGYEAASGALAFGGTSASLDCAGSADVPSFSLAYLTPSASPQIVVTERCDDATTGVSQWLVDSLTCQ